MSGFSLGLSDDEHLILERIFRLSNQDGFVTEETLLVDHQVNQCINFAGINLNNIIDELIYHKAIIETDGGYKVAF
jgi:hypothetical protein